jgi:hypothetical protein
VEQVARDRWSRDRLLDFQGERLRALIAHAVAASPYYRELLGPDAASGDVPLQELPTLPKATLMDNFDRIVIDPRLRRAELEAHVSGPDAGRPHLGRYRVFSTAGTTGVRGLFVEDADEFAVWGRSEARVAVHPFRLRAPFSELLEVRQYQVVHDPAGLHVAVVRREDAPADNPARVRAALAAELGDAGAVPLPIEVTPVPRIDRDPGHGAKFKLVRSRPAPSP